MKRLWLRVLGAGAFLGLGVAVAQVASPPIQTILNWNSDLIPIIPMGAPGPQSKYVTPGALTGVQSYIFGGTVITSATYTYVHGQTLYSVHAAGTLALITPTTEPNPSDGQRECFYSDTITTSLAWTANTGQTIGANVNSVGAAKVPNCIIYDSATATWYGSS